MVRSFRLFIALIAFSALVSAQSSLSAALSWIAPTTNSDGSPITATLTYNVYQGSGATASACVMSTTPVLMGVSTTAVTITTGLSGGSTSCFAASAVGNGIEGAKSNTAYKVFAPIKPGHPTNMVAK